MENGSAKRWKDSGSGVNHLAAALTNTKTAILPDNVRKQIFFTVESVEPNFPKSLGLS